MRPTPLPQAGLLILILFLLTAYQLPRCMVAEETGATIGSWRGSAITEWMPRVYIPAAQDAHRESPDVHRVLTARHPGYRRFRTAHGGSWLVMWNACTAAPHRLVGDGVDLDVPASRAGDESPSVTALDVSCRAFLDRHRDLFGLDATASLRLDWSRNVAGMVVLRYTQIHHDVPVLGGGCVLRVTSVGRLLDIITDTIPAHLLLDVPAIPAVTVDRAEDSLEALGALAGSPRGVTERRLVVLPLREADVDPPSGPYARTASAPVTAPGWGRLLPRLAWELTVPGEGAAPSWSYYVAAQDADAPGQSPLGAILGRRDLKRRFDHHGRVSGFGSPHDLPDTSWNPPTPKPLANLQIVGDHEVALTSKEGTFRVEGSMADSASVLLQLAGPYCHVETDSGEAIALNASIAAGETAEFVLNDPPSREGTAQVNAFVEVNRAHDFAKSVAPHLVAFDEPVGVRVNVDADCNAFFSPEEGGTLGFYRAGSCVNSAYASMVHHEYCHFMAWKLYENAPLAPSLGEGMADVFAMLVTGSPLIAPSFNGVSGPAAQPLRDLGETPYRYPDDILQGRYRAGLIFGSAVWRFRQSLAEKLGPEMARENLSRLFLDFMSLAPTDLSPGLVLDFLELDDDDHSIFNGTPNHPEILEAFSAVGLEMPASFEIEHVPPADGSGPGPFNIALRLRSPFEFLTPRRVLLTYTFDGGVTRHDLPLEPGGQDEFRGMIPANVDVTTVRYSVTVDATPFRVERFPPTEDVSEWFFFATSDLRTLFSDDFDTNTDRGWRHGLAGNDSDANVDDWQHGRVERGAWSPKMSVLGWLLDPREAFSPPHVRGNDLGHGDGSDNVYEDAVHNFIESPPIDCRGLRGTRLRFRRSLSAERGDRCRILVNGETIYDSPADRDLHDASWRHVDYDISRLADGQPAVRVRFELESNSRRRGGGWTIDDFEVLALDPPSWTNGVFIRGDVDLSWAIGINDPIGLLRAIFLGDDTVPCEDAADADDDEELKMADAMFMLIHQFLGGLTPPAPFPSPGLDLTGNGDLDCRRGIESF